MAPVIYVLNGPNLNLLGVRQPEVYGRETLAEIGESCRRKAAEFGLAVEFLQSNHEGDLVDWVQEARAKAAGIVVNAGAYTHTSVALLDALLACDKPVIEVHLSHIHKREAFRQHSYVAQAAQGMICGFGGLGYLLAIEALARIINK